MPIFVDEDGKKLVRIRSGQDIERAYVGQQLVYISRAGIPTITLTDHNTFSFSAFKATAYYVSTSSTKPTAGAPQSTFALNKWTTKTTTGNLTLSANTTYYVWAESRTNGGVSKTYASISVRKITRSQGTGTTLTTRYANSDETGTFTGTTTYVLNGCKISASAELKSVYYIDLVLQKNSVSIEPGSTFTITEDTTISSSATALKSQTLSGTPVSVRRNTETQTFSFSERQVKRVEIYLLHNIKTTTVYLTKGSTSLTLGSMWGYSGDDKWFSFTVDSDATWTGIRTSCALMSNTEGYTIQTIIIYYV